MPPTGTAASQAPPATPHWSNLFTSTTREHGFEPLDVEGAMPDDLTGTLYRVGPGMFELFGTPYGHLFDGDGAVTAIRFDGGHAEGAHRLVESDGLTRERAAGKQLFPGFGTKGRGWRRFPGSFKNAANTNIVSWEGRLLALYEALKPTELDPETLDTIGVTTLGGAVRRAFSAHPHRVASRDALYNFGLRPGLTTYIDIFEWRRGSPNPRRLTSFPAKQVGMLHDFMVTDKYIVFFAAPIGMKVAPMLLGLKTVAESLTWNPERGTQVYVIPLDEPRAVTHFTVDPFAMFHFANGFDDGDTITVDFAYYPEYDCVNDGLGRDGLLSGKVKEGLVSTLKRARLNPRTHTFDMEDLYPHSIEFMRITPAVEGASYRYTYANGHTTAEAARESFFNALVKVDLESGDAQVIAPGDGHIPSEPVFVPRSDASGEDDGYVLSIGYDPAQHRSYLGAWDARALDDGPVGRAWFDHHIPVTFHGDFVPA